MLIRRDRKTGAIWIPRHDAATEADLDRRFHRSRAGELRWLPFPRDEQHVERLYGALAGKRAVLFGKGPSIDSFDSPPLPGEVWCGVNETACIVRGLDYAVMIDPSVMEGLRARGFRCEMGCRLLTRWDRREYARHVEAPDQPAWYFTHDSRVPWQHATTGTAIMLLAAFGIRQVLLVGMDGVDAPQSGYAERLSGIAMPSRAQRIRGWSWQDITAQTVHALDWTGMEATWWHRDPVGIRRYRQSIARAGAAECRAEDGSESTPTVP